MACCLLSSVARIKTKIIPPYLVNFECTFFVKVYSLDNNNSASPMLPSGLDMEANWQFNRMAISVSVNPYPRNILDWLSALPMVIE